MCRLSNDRSTCTKCRALKAWQRPSCEKMISICMTYFPFEQARYDQECKRKLKSSNSKNERFRAMARYVLAVAQSVESRSKIKNCVQSLGTLNRPTLFSAPLHRSRQSQTISFSLCLPSTSTDRSAPRIDGCPDLHFVKPPHHHFLSGGNVRPLATPSQSDSQTHRGTFGSARHTRGRWAW